MPDYIQRHKDSIVFVVSLLTGLTFVGWGLVDGDLAIATMGAGVLGFPELKKSWDGK